MRFYSFQYCLSPQRNWKSFMGTRKVPEVVVTYNCSNTLAVDDVVVATTMILPAC